MLPFSAQGRRTRNNSVVRIELSDTSISMGKLVRGGVGWETAVELNEFNQ